MVWFLNLHYQFLFDFVNHLSDAAGVNDNEINAKRPQLWQANLENFADDDSDWGSLFFFFVTLLHVHHLFLYIIWIIMIMIMIFIWSLIWTIKIYEYIAQHRLHCQCCTQCHKLPQSSYILLYSYICYTKLRTTIVVTMCYIADTYNAALCHAI